jgi:hypothetical protein
VSLPTSNESPQCSENRPWRQNPYKGRDRAATAWASPDRRLRKAPAWLSRKSFSQCEQQCHDIAPSFHSYSIHIWDRIMRRLVQVSENWDEVPCECSFHSVTVMTITGAFQECDCCRGGESSFIGRCDGMLVSYLARAMVVAASCPCELFNWDTVPPFVCIVSALFSQMVSERFSVPRFFLEGLGRVEQVIPVCSLSHRTLACLHLSQALTQFFFRPPRPRACYTCMFPLASNFSLSTSVAGSYASPLLLLPLLHFFGALLDGRETARVCGNRMQLATSFPRWHVPTREVALLSFLTMIPAFPTQCPERIGPEGNHRARKPRKDLSSHSRVPTRTKSIARATVQVH